MLSENEKEANRKFYAANGKTQSQEAGDSARGLVYMVLGSLALAVAAGLFYLFH